MRNLLAFALKIDRLFSVLCRTTQYFGHRTAGNCNKGIENKVHNSYINIAMLKLFSIENKILKNIIKYCKRIIFSVYDNWRTMNFLLFCVDFIWWLI